MHLKFYNSSKFENRYNLPTIFLAGPTDRDKEASPWRQEFVRKASKIGVFNHTVFVIPEFCTEEMDDNLDLVTYPQGAISLSDFEPVELNTATKLFPRERIYQWERSNLRAATFIVFWVARNLKENRMALTTNIEFGNFYNSGKCICGSPPDADKIDYLKWVWEVECKGKWYSSQEEMIERLADLVVNYDCRK